MKRLLLIALLAVLCTACKKENDKTGTCTCDDHFSTRGKQEYGGMTKGGCDDMNIRLKLAYPEGECYFDPTR